MTPSKSRIVILEDDIACRRMMEASLRADYDCIPCGSGKELLRFVVNNAPDLILIDIGLPGENGLEIAREIRRYSDVPMIFITGYDRETNEAVALDLGGDDFVCKPFSPSALAARIRRLLKRVAANVSSLEKALSFCDLRLDPGKLEVVCDRPCGYECRAHLTAMEFDIFRHLVHAEEHVVCRDNFMRAIYGRSSDPQCRNIDVHIAHVRSKLYAAFGVEDLIQTLRGKGYRISHIEWNCPRQILKRI